MQYVFTDTSLDTEMEANKAELKRRGITDEVIAAFSLAWSTALPFAFKEGIVLPVNHPDGTFFFNKYRRSYLNNEIKQKYAYDVGGRTALYAVDHLKEEHQQVVITEGEMDTLVLWSKNISAVSSTGGAQSFQKDFAPILEGKKVYLCYDNDEAGAVGLVKTLEILPEAYVIFIPEVVGVKDISDFVSRGGDFHALMQTAKQYKTREDVEEDRVARASQWLSVRFHDAWIDAHTPKPEATYSGTGYKGDDELLRAKAVPCTALMTFNRQRKAKCLWHADHDPSLHYYPKKNNCYCHVCGKFSDSLDIVMALQGVTLKEAISILTKV